MRKLRKPNGYWTKEKCLVIAKKYTSRKEWRRNDKSSWNAANRLNCYEECTEHMEIIKNGW